MRKALFLPLLILLVQCHTLTPTEQIYSCLKEREGLMPQYEQASLDRTDRTRAIEFEQKIAQLDRQIALQARQNQARFVGLLMKGEEGDRILAAVALGYVPDKVVMTALVEALKDPSPRVRKAAAGSLGMLALEETPMDNIKPLLSDADAGVRSAATFALYKLVRSGRDRALLEPLVKLLEDSDVGVRAHVVLAIGVLILDFPERKKIDEVLAKLALKESSPAVRGNIALVLAQSKDPQFNDCLIELLRDENHSVVEAAALALNAINGENQGGAYGTWKNWWDEKKHEAIRAGALPKSPEKNEPQKPPEQKPQ